jgi:hypothetical protein
MVLANEKFKWLLYLAQRCDHLEQQDLGSRASLKIPGKVSWRVCKSFGQSEKRFAEHDSNSFAAAMLQMKSNRISPANYNVGVDLIFGNP